jgi:hypothetical protein
VHGTGSGSCPVAGFVINGVESLGSATSVLITGCFESRIPV